ncbi:helix-turn-helix domain-containing protein [Mycoplasma phocimorsus]|uniref:helix-turn-helix domain-containing protein n=1 Tax=Mycoplasma phocimorsus TaxID=3045839 RepID=UPI0034E03682
MIFITKNISALKKEDFCSKSLENNVSIRSISRTIGKSPSTISRRIKRNSNFFNNY